MKETGIVRKIDELGRVVLPIELRRTLGLEVRDPVEICLEGESILLRRFERSCVFCGGIKGVKPFHTKLVCGECRRHLTEE